MALSLPPAAFAAVDFDYVIAGGGTAGLAVATRLSEIPTIKVGVIEAGIDHTDDPLVLTPGLASAQWNNPSYDWAFATTPQTYGNGRVVGHPRGKQLGGSSAINFLYWTHASQRDINDWGRLGNSGWSWAELEPYFNKSEAYNPPPASVSEQVDTKFIDPSQHGLTGPVQDSFGTYFDNFYKAWEPTYKNLGLGPTGDPRGGLAIGAYSTLLTLEPKNASRSYSANAYWKPKSARPNLHVLTAALAEKILFDSGKTPLIATGVKYSANGSSYIASAKREVIICAGAFQSPHLLELSGIGDSTLLQKHGINPLYDNKNVGENLQDHLIVPLSFEANRGETTAESYRNTTFLQEVENEYVNEHTGPLSAISSNSYVSFSQIQEAIHHEGDLLSGSPFNGSSMLEKIETGKRGKQNALTLGKLLSPAEATIQEVFLPGGSSPSLAFNASLVFTTDAVGNYFTIFAVIEHPFSRGSVHMTSPSPADYPAIDPNYLSHPLDTYVVGQALLHVQQVARTPPLSTHLKNGGTVYQPGFHELDEETVEAFAKGHFSSEYHPCGTSAMLPRDEGGVVDAKFKVYGTNNLRIVDASIFPLEPRGNLVSLVYAIAERAADFIKGDME